MFLWRVSNYSTLDGTGGLYASGRWHTRGHPIIYCTQSPSTALLETLVHLEIDAEDRPERFQAMKIAVPDAVSQESVSISTLQETWATDLLETRSIGDRWLAQRRSLLLEVPSVLAPETWNVLINPLHPEWSRLTIVHLYTHAFDARLFR